VLTQPSTLSGMVKWVLAFGMSSNKWWLWLWYNSCQVRRIGGSSWSAWSKAQQPPGGTHLHSSSEPDELLAVPWWQHHKHCHNRYYFTITLSHADCYHNQTVLVINNKPCTLAWKVISWNVNNLTNCYYGHDLKLIMYIEPNTGILESKMHTLLLWKANMKS